MRPDAVRDVFGALDATPSAEFAEALLAKLRAEHSTSGLDTIGDDAPDPLEARPIDVVPVESRGLGRRDGNGRRHRRRIAVVAAAAALCVVIATVVLSTGGDDGSKVISPADPIPPTTTAPPVQRVGFLGLPPEGATANIPETAELVASWYAAPHLAFPGGGWYGVSDLFSDGSLVSRRFNGPVISTPDPSKDPGWFVQRLTPAGVDLVRAEILSTGLFASDVAASRGTFGVIEVRNGDRLVNVSVNSSGSPNEVDLLRRLGDLQSWLPDWAWESREMTAWVPSRYSVCLMSDGGHGPAGIADPASVVALLPAPAREVLGSATKRAEGDTPCFDMTTQQARELAAAFDAAGFDENTGNLSLSYSFDAGREVLTEAVSTTVWIGFAPLRPDGAVPSLSSS